MLTTILFSLHWIVVLFVAVKVVFRRLPVGTSLAWIIVVSIAPVIGFAFYLLIGDHRIGRQRFKYGDLVRRYYQATLGIPDDVVEEDERNIDKPHYKIAHVAASDTGFHVRAKNKVKIISDSTLMFDSILSDIQSAQESCHLEFYIIDVGGRVIGILEAVEAAAQRGVDCKIIADHVGSKNFFKSKWPQRLAQAGVTVIDSLPIGVIKSFFTRSDLRNHRKIIIIDRKTSYTGSFNLADPDVFKVDKNCGKWVDILMRIEGHATDALSVVFNTDFVIETHDRKKLSSIPALPEIDRAQDLSGFDKPVQVIPSGPEMRTSIIHEVLVSSIYAAQNTIKITTPYLIPDESLLLALTNAARRGVSVTIIVPAQVDSILARFASRSYYSEMLKAGLKILHYKAGLLHSKIVMIDDEVVFLGTVNLDMRSFYLNLEVTTALHSPEDCQDVNEIFAQYCRDSEEVNPQDWIEKDRSKPAIFVENLVRLASPLL